MGHWERERSRFGGGAGISQFACPISVSIITLCGRCCLIRLSLAMSRPNRGAEIKNEKENVAGDAPHPHGGRNCGSDKWKLNLLSVH